jgi:hypothetical protein
MRRKKIKKSKKKDDEKLTGTFVKASGVITGPTGLTIDNLNRIFAERSLSSDSSVDELIAAIKEAHRRG